MRLRAGWWQVTVSADLSSQCPDSRQGARNPHPPVGPYTTGWIDFDLALADFRGVIDSACSTVPQTAVLTICEPRCRFTFLSARYPRSTNDPEWNTRGRSNDVQTGEYCALKTSICDADAYPLRILVAALSLASRCDTIVRHAWIQIRLFEKCAAAG